MRFMFKNWVNLRLYLRSQSRLEKKFSHVSIRTINNMNEICRKYAPKKEYRPKSDSNASDYSEATIVLRLVAHSESTDCNSRTT